MTKHCRDLIQQLEQKQLFAHKQNSIICAPHHKIPTGSVPNSGAKPHNGDVHQLAGNAFPVSAQGDIHIFPEPSAQGNVPSAPKFRDAFGNIRILEVLQKGKAKHFPQPNRHIGITGEVEIDLEGVGNGADPGAHHAQFPDRHGGKLRPNRADAVCQQYLLGQAQHKPLHTVGEHIGGFLSVVQLLRNGGIPHDRPRHQLGKQSHISAKRNDIPLSLGISSIHVDGIRHGLERIERNADGQRQVQKRNRSAGDGVDVSNNKIAVLKEAQHP